MENGFDHLAKALARENGFDELAKVLARGVSRRQTLWWIGGVLAGTMLPSLGLGRRAWAQASAACTDFCENAYPPGPRSAFDRLICRIVCTRQCERVGVAPCLTPGGDPSGPGVTRCECEGGCCPPIAPTRERCCEFGGTYCCDPNQVCAETVGRCCDPDQVCVGLGGVNCCEPNQNCCGMALCCDGPCCGPQNETCCEFGQVCQDEQCVSVCTDPDFSTPCPALQGGTFCCGTDATCCSSGTSTGCCVPDTYCCFGTCCLLDEICHTYTNAIGDTVPLCCPANGPEICLGAGDLAGTAWCRPAGFTCCSESFGWSCPPGEVCRTGGGCRVQ